MGNLAGCGLGLPAHDRRTAAAAGGGGVMTSITSLEEIRQQRQGLQGPQLFHRAVAVFGENNLPAIIDAVKSMSKEPLKRLPSLLREQLMDIFDSLLPWPKPRPAAQVIPFKL